MYTKQAFTIVQQIAQLQERGLITNKADDTEHYLSHISYYRLAGYWWPMQQDKVIHIFKPGSKFGDVIEKIEFSFRTKLIYHLSHEFDPWWFQGENKSLNILS